MLRHLLCGSALVVLVGCGGSDDPVAPSATIAPAESTSSTTSTTEAMTPEEEVEAAYLRSWEVYAEAVRDLDDSRLDEVYDGEALTTVQSEVTEYAANRTPVRVEVEHQYQVQILEPGLAAVIDQYRNHSVFVDPDTGEPTEPDPNKILVETYGLRQIEGTWKVTSVVRQG